MSFFSRLNYALYLAIVIFSISGLTLSIIQGIGHLHEVFVGDILFHPLFLIPVFLFSYITAPLFSAYFQVTGWEDASPDRRNKTKNFFAIRQIFIVFVGLLLILVANLLVYFIGGKP